MLPAHFSRIGLCLQSWYIRYFVKKKTKKNICLVLIIMSILLKSSILNHIILNFWYRVIGAHTSEARAQKATVTRHVSTKLSSLSCLIALKLSNTHTFILITRVTKRVSYVCEGEQLGKKLHVYISSTIYSKPTALVSSEAGTLNSVLCSSVQPNTEQLACFAWTFTMALEMVHRCRWQKHYGNAVGGNLQIKRRWYYNKILFLRHRGAKPEQLIFSCRKRLQKDIKIYWVVLFHVFWVGRCTGDPIIALKHRKRFSWYVTFKTLLIKPTLGTRAAQCRGKL